MVRWKGLEGGVAVVGREPEHGEQRSDNFGRSLIVTADDFGASASVNEAVHQAHQDGVLTAASLLVNGGAVEHAVAIAEAHPLLGVGLHLTLTSGRCLSPAMIAADITDAEGQFRWGPAELGLRLFFRPDWEPMIRWEVEAQVDRFLSTGLPMDHVDGHHHLHLHPTVLRILCDVLRERRAGCRWIRWVHDPLWVNLRMGERMRWGIVLNGVAFGFLRVLGRSEICQAGLNTADRVYGLWRTGRMDARYLQELIRRMPGVVSEIYLHPDTATPSGRRELAALRDPGVRAVVGECGLRLRGYGDED